MSFSIGIVGLPNVGKSTLFKALTKKQVDTSNYPFCTIDPNVGVVAVPDGRLPCLAALSKSVKTIPTTIEFVDIAGLVKNAHSGEGLGNQFLAHIREVDAIVHLIRGFQAANVIHIDGSVDAERDEATILLELVFADLETVKKRMETVEGGVRSGDLSSRGMLGIYDKLLAVLESGQPARSVELSQEERNSSKDLHLLTAKPILVVKNVSEEEIRKEGRNIRICAKLEAELSECSEEDGRALMAEYGIKESGLDLIVRKSYSMLDLMTFLTTGPKETRAWTVSRGTKAPQAAGVIHSDFEKHFIRADVIFWEELVRAGSETRARELGLVRTEGKDYVIRDGDVVHFRVNV